MEPKEYGRSLFDTKYGDVDQSRRHLEEVLFPEKCDKTRDKLALKWTAWLILSVLCGIFLWSFAIWLYHFKWNHPW